MAAAAAQRAGARGEDGFRGFSFRVQRFRGLGVWGFRVCRGGTVLLLAGGGVLGFDCWGWRGFTSFRRCFF